MEFPLIDIAGPPDVRGRQYGERAKRYIHKSVAIYKHEYARRGVDWGQAITIAGGFLPRIKSAETRLFGEIEGIAAGADLQVEEVLALNARTEILNFNQQSGRDDGCTGAIILPAATANGHMLHGQNWDWLDGCTESAIILRITPEKGPRIITHTEAGNLARCGMNEVGVGLTGNFLKCEHDAQQHGVPIPFIRRRILESEHFAKAIEVVMASSLSFSTNLMISDAGGEAINLETTPKEVFWIAPNDHMLVHANHFISPAALSKITDKGIAETPCTLYRGRRVEAAFRADYGTLTIDHMKQAFLDNFGSPYGVCSEPAKSARGEVYSTVATILMDTTEKKMWVAKAPYKGADYKEYNFETNA